MNKTAFGLRISLFLRVFALLLIFGGAFWWFNQGPAGDKLEASLESFFNNFGRFRAALIPEPPSSEMFSSELPFWEEIGSTEEPVPEKEIIEEEIREPEIIPEPKLTLAGIQEEIDDISERIDLMGEEVRELAGVDSVEKKESAANQEPADEEEAETVEEESEEELEEIDEEELVQEGNEFEKEEIFWCQKKPGDQARKNRIIFNEIAWMGSLKSSSDEWMEMKNISGEEISLNGWQILDKKGQIKIIFEKDIIPAGGFYLLERSNDDSAPDAPADFIYSGPLNDKEEVLYLFGSDCRLEDEVKAEPDWPAGDKADKKSMERKADLSWQTSSNSNGTPKKENSKGYFIFPSSGGGGGGSPPPAAYPKILISEVQISPIEERFIEIYNPNEIEVNLTGWYVQRKTKNAASWNSLAASTQFEGRAIQAKNYLLISRMFENSDILLGDLTLTEDNSIVLKNPKREIVDLVGWGLAQDFETASFLDNPGANQSLGRIWDSEYRDSENNSADFEIQPPTPKFENVSFSPILDVSPSILYFSTGSQSETLNIRNIGTGSLDWEGIIEYATPSFEGIGWLGLEPSSGFAPPDSEISVSADISDLASGDYFAKIIIQAEGAEESPKKVEVILNIEEPAPPEEPEQIPQTVVINEIAWMGTFESPYDEWIELYNNTSNAIDLLDWQLTFVSEERIIDFDPSLLTATPVLDGFGYFLLERTNDESVPEIGADIIYKGNLDNNGEHLQLKNNQGELIDEVNCSSEWFAGENETKKTMERIDSSASGNDSENWQNSQNPGGTPRVQNSFLGGG